MKTIEKKFVWKGAKRKLLDRKHDVAMYAVDGGGKPSYEVVVVRNRKSDVYIDGRKICSAGDEYLPSQREWGIYGFTHINLKDAISRMESMTQYGRYMDRHKEHNKV